MNNPSDADSLSPNKQALLKIRELKQQLADARSGQSEDIAIVSMACRFPRHSDSPESFWRLCKSDPSILEQAKAVVTDQYFEREFKVPPRRPIPSRKLTTVSLLTVQCIQVGIYHRV